MGSLRRYAGFTVAVSCRTCLGTGCRGLVQLVREAAAGIAEVVEMPPLTLGEDFAIYLEHLPGAFWTLGVCPPEQEEMPPLHNPAMAPDERAIPIGVDLLFAACTKFLKEQLTMND